MIVPRLLPEFCYSKRELQIAGITVHYLSAINVDPERAFDLDTCWNLLVELNRPGPQRGPLIERDDQARAYASYHRLIDRDGNRYKLTPWTRQAYHAGVSAWRGRKNCNAWMAGIALLATHDSGFTDAQYRALITDCRALRARQPIALDDIVGHEHVAPGRKIDPGPLFDWDRLRAGVSA